MTGFEPAASGVTGRRSKPLSYTREQTESMAHGGSRIKAEAPSQSNRSPHEAFVAGLEQTPPHAPGNAEVRSHSSSDRRHSGMIAEWAGPDALPDRHHRH